MEKGLVPFTSRVIPLNESLEAVQEIMPSEKVLNILGKARLLLLADCACRTHYGRCDKPLEICLYLDEAADRMVEQKRGRVVSLEEAAEKLKLAHRHGLVHLAIRTPDQYPLAVCSCCFCCCHDLQLLVKFGHGKLVARSAYLAVTDWEACVHCGDCVERCGFQARILEKGRLSFDPDRCYGCGLCVTACPTGAVSLKEKGDAGWKTGGVAR